MKKKILKLCLCLALVAVLIFTDQWTKGWAATALKGKPDMILIPGVFQLHYLENTGMAFGLLKNRQTFFFLITIIILAFVGFILIRTPEKKRYFPIHIVTVLLIAGAVGNMIDRTSQKYVVDFLYFSLIDFPVFNVADCFVTCAAVLALILLLFVYKEEELTEIYRLKQKPVSKEEADDDDE